MISDPKKPTETSPAKKKIARLLLEIGAVKLSVDSPFTWASGIQAPIYCDNRIIAAHVSVRKAILEEFIQRLNPYLPEIDLIAGVATGGMTFGALIADRLDLPFIYVRPERKVHGLKKQVEGAYREGNRVMLIEDHISTGASSMKAIEGLRDEKLVLIALLSIMTYGFQSAADLFNSRKVIHESICDLDAIIEVAREQDISSAQAEAILRFREIQGNSLPARGIDP
jgi:orotate phosphoribosyltransferase